MLKTICLATILLLSGCRSNSKPAPNKEFSDKYLLFDLEEESSRSPCAIQGEIPSWLSGTLLRNGPAKFTVGDRRVDWFDGLAMLHAFDFDNQTVFYTNRFIRSEQYYIMMVEKSLNFSGFAQDPCPKVFKNQISRFIPAAMKEIENADVTIQNYADQMVALTEQPLPVVFDPKTLETLGNFQYSDALPKSRIWESAHAQHDIASQETFNYYIEFGETSNYCVWKMGDHQSAREIVAKIPVDLPAYMHSFALTEHYVILVQFPFVVNPIDLMSGKKPFIFNYKWKPERGTVFLVIDRATGNLAAKIKGDPFFAFHHINAYDKEGKIYIDIATHLNANIMKMITNEITQPQKIKKAEETKFERFTIDLNTAQLSRETIFPKSVELPRVPADRTAREYRYGYLIDATFPVSLTDRRPLYKVDVQSKKALEWSEEGCFPGEPIFVPNPSGQEEDDGVVLSLILDYAHQRSFLLILDARDFTELARAEAPHAIPVGLHGMWK